MHDLNDALDELRHVIPYAHSPSVRKLSKIATLLLAKNYILIQANALNELRRVLLCLHQHARPALPQALSASVAALLTNSASLATPTAGGKQQSWSPGGATVAAGSCSANSSSVGESTKLSPSRDQTGGGQRGSAEELPSVQNRRRKYNMLINRILGDVASQQQLLIPSQQQRQDRQPARPAPGQLQTGKQPIDFCTQMRSADTCGADCSAGNCIQQLETGKRKSSADEKVYSSRSAKAQRRAVRRSSTTTTTTANEDELEANSSGRSSSSASCSSLVSVGSPQLKEESRRVARSHSTTSTIVSYDEHLDEIDEEDNQQQLQVGIAEEERRGNKCEVDQDLL